MRVAYVCADRGVPVFGSKGASIHVQEVVRHLRADGAKVVLFATRRGGPAPPDLSDLKVRKLPRGPSGDVETKERAALAANDALRVALDAVSPFDLVYERHALWSHAGMEHARERGIPGILEVNAPLLDEQRRYRELRLAAQAEEVVARAYGGASAMIAVSEEVAAYLREHPATRAPVHVVPNGVNPDRFAGSHSPALPAPGRFTVGFVGTLKPWHGVGDLLEAFAALHEARPASRLLIVGEGPERADLEHRAADLGPDAVVFTGAIEPAHVPAMLASMDVAVAPYPPLKGFYFSPLKVFEYMAASLPVVGASIGQMSQLISHEVSGLLYPPGDVDAMTSALLELEASADLRRRLGEQARRAVIRDHTWSQVARRILEIAGARATDRATPQQVT